MESDSPGKQTHRLSLSIACLNMIFVHLATVICSLNAQIIYRSNSFAFFTQMIFVETH